MNSSALPDENFPLKTCFSTQPGSGLPESFFRDEALTLPFNLSVVSGKVLSGLTLGETLHHCGSPEMGPVNQGALRFFVPPCPDPDD